MNLFDKIKEEIMNDEANTGYTSLGIEPLFSANSEARIVIVGQAPGRKAQESRLFWNDLSGDRLREWMGISRDVFYESNLIAHLPMDFYYPGKGKSGDLPPRKEFAEKWHPRLMKEMPELEIMILIGSYAQKRYLGDRREKSLTETVRNFRQYLPEYLPLVHPSPRNGGWFKQNPWFNSEVVPVLQEICARLLNR